MTATQASKALASGSYARVQRALGTKLMRINSPIELHERIVEGFPRHTMVYLVEGFSVLKQDESFKALNVSSRTWHRIKAEQKAAPLDADQSARGWSLAEVLTKATEVLGGKEEAAPWLAAPAIGLDSRRPIDLMATPQGAEMVKTLLDQMAYGVYA